MKHRFLTLVLFLLSIFLLAACGGQAGAGQTATGEAATGEAGTGETAMDRAGLVAALQEAGAQVEAGQSIEQAFFTVSGQIIRVNGGDVQVFEYPSAQAMELEAALVSADGSTIGTSMVGWVEPPHFFKKDRVLALYVGSDAAVLDLLRGALGDQFAGQ